MMIKSKGFFIGKKNKMANTTTEKVALYIIHSFLPNFFATNLIPTKAMSDQRTLNIPEIAMIATFPK